MKKINRLKVVLVELDRTRRNSWKKEGTVSCWCTNETLPSLETFVKIAKVLNVDIEDLLALTKN